MPSCDISTSTQLQAYYDGQLRSEAAGFVREHLSTCLDCQAAFSQMNLVSAALADFQPRLLPLSMTRLHQKVAQAGEGVLIRLAWMTSAAAACVMIGGSVWLMRSGGTAAPPAQLATSVPTPPWVSITAAVDDESPARNAATPVAEWYLASATPRSDDVQASQGF